MCATLAGQDYPGPWELVVVDNGSTDRSAAVPARMRPRLPLMRTISAPEARSAGVARNAGVRAAAGDLLLFCDADDVADPGWISAMVAALDDADMVGGSLDCSVLSPAFLDEQPVPLPRRASPCRSPAAPTARSGARYWPLWAAGANTSPVAPARTSNCRPADFGRNAAILWGDLCLVWSDELLHAADLHRERMRQAVEIFRQMRSEVLLGQYLDIRGEASVADPALCYRILLLKSARYTVEHPLQIGAALAGAGRRTVEALSRYGVALGVAFQLRDDVLGAFGDDAETGKSATTDLRDGKSTVMMAMTRQVASPPQLAVLDRWYGNPDLDDEGVAALRQGTKVRRRWGVHLRPGARVSGRRRWLVGGDGGCVCGGAGVPRPSLR